MPVKQAEFFVSNSDPALCPKPDRPEYAFIGRSNVGKSSLINMLTGRSSLAKISGKPGKTQLINHFIIDNEWYLVDLPGYGYAQVSKTDREKFAALIDGYLTSRPNLLCIFVLVDARIAPQKLDLDFMANLGERGLPFVIAFTKTEKLGPVKLQAIIDTYRAKLLETWEEMPPFFITSAITAAGREDILAFIRPLNEEYKNNNKVKPDRWNITKS
ncbi:ribosome biogenesis GTP-binding protein YihA/YsxC [Spirosoma endophyticum]|uniref:Probable GTP-binding protein EngB n=1 Tax=Spirosoma endophyticum TaxID=662367 RepID=A0A1I2FXP8_9BACT|nr:ribosome biogenesis GTP-binding protein YihA/YsxC [Spirosoma endophyticum]SFF09609.1 GTP-binding protein [Spirosoma endophyticum]